MGIFSIFKKDKDLNSQQFRDAYVLALVHKLRTPLNGARWALDTVINKDDCNDKEILTETYNKIISAVNTVTDILKTAEINSKDGALDLNKEKVNLCVIVEDILKNLDYLRQKKEVTIERGNICDPIAIYADRKVLEIGLNNIFDNAYRYSPKGTVRIDISKEGNMAKLVVKDNGIGMTKEDMKHTFEKFYRGENAKLVDSNESGVGLYSTKKIIEMHNGEISIDSIDGKGTTIEVKLPID
jgi:signal transduction histidine kinase